MTDFYFFLTCYWPRMAPWETEHELTVHFFFQKVNNTSSCNVRTSKSNLVILDFVVSVSVFCNYEFYFKRPLKRRALKIIYHWTRIISEDRDTVCRRKLALLFPVYRNTIKIFTFQGSHPSWKALFWGATMAQGDQHWRKSFFSCFLPHNQNRCIWGFNIQSVSSTICTEDLDLVPWCWPVAAHGSSGEGDGETEKKPHCTRLCRCDKCWYFQPVFVFGKQSATF